MIKVGEFKIKEKVYSFLTRIDSEKEKYIVEIYVRGEKKLLKSKSFIYY
jgi:hypothetical protein